MKSDDLEVKMKSKTMFYAGIGARNTPQHVLDLMTDVSRLLSSEGYTLRSGGAKGADTTFENGCGDNKEIFTANDVIPKWCFEQVEKFHPAPDRLGDYPRRLMARNSLILFGKGCDKPVDFIVCYTDNGQIKGGTGQALRIAQHFGIKVHNLGVESVYDKFSNRVKELLNE